MKLKKVLAAILAATMVMSTAMTVCAYGPGNGGYAPSTDSSSSSESGSSTTTAPADVQTANASITVAGTTIRTSVAGAYAAKSVQGIAVVTSLADVKANLGLTGSQQPAITIYDTDEKTSPAALASINAYADVFGVGEVLTVLNINLGAKENGKWIQLKDGSIALTAGLPKGCDTTKEYAVIAVYPGGEGELLDDQDTNPNTITFKVSAGLGAYAIVAK